MSNQRPQPPRPPVSPHEIAQIRDRVRDVLTAAQTRAHASGRPLLVLAGENHAGTESALLTTIIYQEARRIGVRDVALEEPADTLNDKQSALNLSMPVSRLNLFGHSLFYRQSRFYGDRAHMVDSLRYVGEAARTRGPEAIAAAVRVRDEAIGANLARMTVPVLMLTGGIHLPGLEQQMARHGTHEVVSFNVDGRPSTDTAPGRTHIRLRGSTATLGIQRFFELGMGQPEAARFRQWAERTDNLYSQRDISRILGNIPRPDDVAALVAQMNALYDRHRDFEAGWLFRELAPICVPQRHPAPPCAEVQQIFEHKRRDVSPEFQRGMDASLAAFNTERARRRAAAAHDPAASLGLRIGEDLVSHAMEMLGQHAPPATPRIQWPTAHVQQPARQPAH